MYTYITHALEGVPLRGVVHDEPHLGAGACEAPELRGRLRHVARAEMGREPERRERGTDAVGIGQREDPSPRARVAVGEHQAPDEGELEREPDSVGQAGEPLVGGRAPPRQA